MDTPFSADFFRGNRRRLQDALAPGIPIVLTANGILQRTADNQFPLSQDKNFWYLTGIEEPDLILVITTDEEYLIVPGRNEVREAFDGAVDHEALTGKSGILTILDEKAGWDKLTAAVKAAGQVQSIESPPAYMELFGMYTNPARAKLVETLRAEAAGLQIKDIRQELMELRIIKQPAELQAIERAVAIAIDGLSEIMLPENLEKYEYEYQIEADLSRAFRRTGGSGHSFQPVVAGGRRACTFHNFTNNSRLAKDELIILDVGAEYCQYSSDISRTISLQKPTARQRAVHDAVREAQEFGIGLLKPGVSFKECELQVRQFIGGQLKQLGLVKSVDDEAIHKYYPHAPHFLGLDVHDVGDYERPLEPGMVLTCEPGIYIPEESIGVRIEDDILITSDGHKILSAKLPKKLM